MTPKCNQKWVCLEIINTPFRGKFFLSVNTSQSNSGCSETSDHLSRAEKSPCDFFRRKIKLRKKIFRKFVDKKGRIIIFLGHGSIRFPRFSRKGGEGRGRIIQSTSICIIQRSRVVAFTTLWPDISIPTPLQWKLAPWSKLFLSFPFFFLTNFEISKKLKRN